VEPDCPFCQIVEGVTPATIIERNPRHLVIEPLKPYVPGHVLVLPTEHLDDVTTAPIRSGHILERAARYAEQVGPSNILTSYGARATQTIRHLHLHVLPRSDEDGLHRDWPWCRDGLDVDMPT